VQSGDIAIALVIANNTSAVTNPSGWTTISTASSSGGSGSSVRAHWAYKVLAADDVGSIVTFGIGGSSPVWRSGVAIYRGQHLTTPIGAHNAMTMVTANPFTIGAITPAASTAWVLAAFLANDPFTLTPNDPPTGLTSRFTSSGAQEITLYDTNGPTAAYAGESTSLDAGLWGVSQIELVADAGGAGISVIETVTNSGSGTNVGASFKLPGTRARVTSVAAEAYILPTPAVRTTSVVAETYILPSTVAVRTTSVVVEAFFAGAPQQGSFGVNARLKGANHKGGGKAAGDTTLTLNKPSGTAQGDILIASVSDDAGSNTTITSVPSGWSLVGTRQTSGTVLGQAVYRYIVPSGAPANWTWTLSGNIKSAGVIDAYSSVLDVQVFGQQVNAASTSVVAPTITTTSPNTMLVFVGSTAANTSFTPPSGMIEDPNTDQGTAGVSTEIAHKTPTAQGATGTRTATAGTSAVNIGTLLALPVSSEEFWDFGIDAIVLTAPQGTTTLDAVIKKTQSASFGIDAVIFSSGPSVVEDDFGLDAVLLKTQGATFSLDAVLRRTYAADFGSDAIIRATATGGFDLQAVLLSPQSDDFGLDAFLLKVVQSTFGADAVVKKTTESSFGINAIQKATFEGDADLDAVIRRTTTASFGADSVIFKTIESAFGLNAIQKDTLEGSFSLAAIQRKTFTADFGIDAWKLKVVTATTGFNAIVLKTQEHDFGLNAVLTRGIPFFVEFGDLMAAVVGFTAEGDFISATSTANQIASTSSATGYLAATNSAEFLGSQNTYHIEHQFGLNAWIEV